MQLQISYSCQRFHIDKKKINHAGHTHTHTNNILIHFSGRIERNEIDRECVIVLVFQANDHGLCGVFSWHESMCNFFFNSSLQLLPQNGSNCSFFFRSLFWKTIDFHIKKNKISANWQFNVISVWAPSILLNHFRKIYHHYFDCNS